MLPLWHWGERSPSFAGSRKHQNTAVSFPLQHTPFSSPPLALAICEGSKFSTHVRQRIPTDSTWPRVPPCRSEGNPADSCGVPPPELRPAPRPDSSLLLRIFFPASLAPILPLSWHSVGLQEARTPWRPNSAGWPGQAHLSATPCSAPRWPQALGSTI